MSEIENLENSEAAVIPRRLQLTDLKPILDALQGLRYGSVEVFVQDFRFMQIDRKEKIRLPKS